MVSTGAPRNSATRKSEIIDILANDDVTCKDIDDYPLEIEHSVASNIASFPRKVINVGSDTFGNPIFQKGLQN